jgi:hypothetical protein
LTLKSNLVIMDIVHSRRDVRAVYGAGLENQRRVKASEGSNPSLSSRIISYKFNEVVHGEVLKFGRRGAPAKGVGRETGARVRIPPSPPLKNS